MRGLACFLNTERCKRQVRSVKWFLGAIPCKGEITSLLILDWSIYPLVTICLRNGADGTFLLYQCKISSSRHHIFIETM